MAPEGSTPPSPGSQSSNPTLAKIREIAAKVWQVSAPVLESLTLGLGRGIDWTLDKGLPQLQTTVTTSGLYQQQVQPRLEPVQKRVVPVWSKVQPVLLTLWSKGIQPLWTKGLSVLRSRLSEPLTRELSDRALTVMILGLVLLLYWLIGTITPSAAPAQEPSVTPAPTSQPAAKTKDLAKNLEKVKPRLAALADAYDEALMLNVDAELLGQPTLRVTLSDRWYNLTPTQQNQFAADLLRLSQAQKFSELKVKDESGTLVIRNPVVGDRAIILQRQAI